MCMWVLATHVHGELTFEVILGIVTMVKAKGLVYYITILKVEQDVMRISSLPIRI